MRMEGGRKISFANRRLWIAASGVAIVALVLLCARYPAGAQSDSFTGVLTFHNDNLRTGQNLDETILTPANVNPTHFGLLFTEPVDGQIYAQPLYVPAVPIAGQGTHNIVIVATENDSVYAFDADVGGAPLWQTSLLANGEIAIPASDTGCGDLTPQIGITGTPVIDPATDTLYAVAATREGSAKSYVYAQWLHALDITTGAEVTNSPMQVQGSVPGSSPYAKDGMISVLAYYNNQRAGLLLDNGVIYMAFSSHCDYGPYNGFVLGYDETSLEQVAAYSEETDSEGIEGGIWMSGGGLATDTSGDVFLATGNGTFDANTGGPDYGDSFIRLTPAGNSFTVDTYFTPRDQGTLANDDEDLGSGALLLLPDQPAPPTHLALGVGKQGILYLVNRDAMGGYRQGAKGADKVIEKISVGALFSAPAYFNNNVYLVPAGGDPKQFRLDHGLLSRTPVATFPQSFPNRGASPSISANGSTDGILWLIRDSNNTAVLYALKASNISKKLYDSAQKAARDTAGPFNKFQVPTIANGKVYVGTQTQLAVYGLLPGSKSMPAGIATSASTLSPANLVTVTHAVTGAAYSGQPRNGGSFMLTNLSGAAETISSVTVSFSNPAMFESAALRALDASASRYAKVEPPAARTTFTFKSPLKLPAGASATFHLDLTASEGATAPSDQVVTAIAASSSPVTQGLPADLGTVSPPSE